MSPHECLVSKNKDHLLLKTKNELTLTFTITEIEERFRSKFEEYKALLRRKPFPITMLQMRGVELG